MNKLKGFTWISMSDGYRLVTSRENEIDSITRINDKKELDTLINFLVKRQMEIEKNDNATG